MRISENYITKLKHVLPAFSLSAWSSVILLSFTRWLFFLGKYPILELDEDLWNIWIPLIFPWIPVLIWLRPWFNAFTFKKDNDKGSWQMQVLGWITITAMLAFSQHFLTTHTGKLLELQTVKDIRKHERVRYYRIKQFSVYKYIGGVHSAFRTMGRYNEKLEIDIYFANPILTHKTQPITMTPLYWYGVKFNKQISNWGSNANKEKRFKAFLEECIVKMQHYDFSNLDHFEHKPASYDRENFRIAIQYALRKRVTNDFVILQPRTKSYESRNDYKMAGTIISYAIGIIIYMLLLIGPRLKSKPEEIDIPDAVHD
ncbi:hypothetical protein [Dyadobacter sediminis]|uniref:Uncharacterized protein n=1 Tax=Dyadobacter sediminis TaxID=1493691 RepID=A0A5R9KC91_9BACT|nr:hypothetical protein [Dyadobacter sediminis]TLU92405.1 hypothetical protein FEM55_16925 [Dyadobacter sediminis]GGB94719.1 hypothetical protein GCM10011325_22620 [Dyadobacter sediminis]